MIVGLFAGLLTGGLLLWLVFRYRSALSEERIRSEWAIALAKRDEQINALEAQKRLVEDESLGLRAELADARQQILKTSSRNAELSTQLESERLQSQEKLQVLLQAREDLLLQFRTLASDILEEKSKRFAEQNQSSLGELLEPLKLRLQEFQSKVEQVYVTESKDRSALSEQVRQLMELNHSIGQEARNLTQALKGSSKTRGNWGELILERVLEASGLRRGEEYLVQENRMREDGSRAQPDVIIRLPENRHLVVDAKVSLLAYETYVTEENEEARKMALKQHLDAMRNHIRGLSEKNYPALHGLQSMDFVLMFVPIEPAFMLAVTHDDELFMDAWQRNVLLVSPSTLLFVVRTVAHLWRQEAQNRNAQDIARRGGELYDRLAAFVADLDKVGDRLQQAQESYASARDKLSRNRGNVIRQAEMLRELGVKPTKSLPASWTEAATDDGIS